MTYKRNERVDEHIPDLEGEIWKPIIGYEDAYHVSNMGRVKSLSREIPWNNGGTAWLRGRILKCTAHKSQPFNPRYVSLCADQQVTAYRVTKLVLEHFVGPAKDDKIYALHRDGNVMNNKLDNLYWGSAKQLSDAIFGRGNGGEGAKNKYAKLTGSQVLEVKTRFERGERQCDIANEMQINFRKVWKIVRGYSWRRITEGKQNAVQKSKHLLRKGASNDTKQNETTKAT